jgi:hypothetical protein
MSSKNLQAHYDREEIIQENNFRQVPIHVHQDNLKADQVKSTDSQPPYNNQGSSQGSNQGGSQGGSQGSNQRSNNQ